MCQTCTEHRLPQKRNRPSSSSASTICIISLATNDVPIKLPVSLVVSPQVLAMTFALAQRAPYALSVKSLNVIGFL